MDVEHRLGFLGIALAAIALVATQMDSLPLKLAGLIPFSRAAAAGHSDSDQRDRELMLDRTFDVRPGGQLSVDVADADVSVRVGTGRDATVKVFMSARDREWGRELFDRMDFEVNLRGVELNIDARNPRVERSEWRDNRGGAGFLVEITVPRSFNATIVTGDGDISMGDFDGDFDLTTSDGDITVGTLTGSLQLRTSDGDVSAEGLAGESIAVRTSDGDIRIGALAGAAEISTSDGDIRVYIDRSNDISLRTGDGDITILAPESLSADIDFSGESVRFGSVYSLDGRVTTNGARGSLNGGGPRLFAHTGDGTITLRDGRRNR
jgi:hypothetical protein